MKGISYSDFAELLQKSDTAEHSTMQLKGQSCDFRTTRPAAKANLIPLDVHLEFETHSCTLGRGPAQNSKVEIHLKLEGWKIANKKKKNKTGKKHCSNVSGEKM